MTGFFVGKGYMNNTRNIAVIAHVDHGKTTLIDALLKQTHVFRDNQKEMSREQILDSNDLERERGITIMAKNCAILYKGTKINIIDTPGHADFSGEVERTLGMAEGALLIVDAQEGPMPQTRFVLKKAFELNLKIIVLINKIDKKYARVPITITRLSDLFLDLATTEDQIDFPTLYSVAKCGSVFTHLPKNASQTNTVQPLLETILSHIPAPKMEINKPFKMLVSSLDYDNHLGKIAIGKIYQGQLSLNQQLYIIPNGQSFPVENIFTYNGLDRQPVSTAMAGDIVAIAGSSTVAIGCTIAGNKQEISLPAPIVEPPTLQITIAANTSPFSGHEGLFSTSRQLEERLTRELENNIGLKLEKLDKGRFKVSGRGELHLSILLETMRRQGYEMEIGKPEVIVKRIDNILHEPMEEVNIIVPNQYIGIINQEFGKRQSQLVKMEPISDQETEFIFDLPTRALIGLRSLLLTLTKGTIVLSSQIINYQPLKAKLPKLRKGVIIAAVAGKVTEYGLKNLKGRGISLVKPGDEVYQGMIVGQNAKDDDIEVNVAKEKHLTNHRSKSHDGIAKLASDIEMSLEQSIDFLEKDELLEITPKSLRLRKRYLTGVDRRRALSQSERV